MEGRAALHLERLSRVMREHEDRCVVGRALSPPAAPALVRPGSADGPEHVTSQDPRADILESLCGEVVVDPGFTAFLTKHLPGRTRGKHPLVQRSAAPSERVAEALVRPGAITIQREGEAADDQLRHLQPPQALAVAFALPERSARKMSPIRPGACGRAYMRST